MCNVFINKVQLAFGNEEGIVSLCLNDDTTETLIFKVKNDLGKSSIDDVETCTFFILVGNDYQRLFDTTVSQILYIHYQSIHLGFSCLL